MSFPKVWVMSGEELSETEATCGRRTKTWGGVFMKSREMVWLSFPEGSSLALKIFGNHQYGSVTENKSWMYVKEGLWLPSRFESLFICSETCKQCLCKSKAVSFSYLNLVLICCVACDGAACKVTGKEHQWIKHSFALLPVSLAGNTF